MLVYGPNKRRAIGYKDMARHEAARSCLTVYQHMHEKDIHILADCSACTDIAKACVFVLTI